MTEQDVYTRVTNKIVADLERGNLTWLQPWRAGHAAGPVSRPLRVTGEAYQGINVLILWATAIEKGYEAPIYMTFKQAHKFGGHVKKGEKGAPVVFADTLTRMEQDENGDKFQKEIPFLKAYTVFNVEQIEGLPEKFYARAEPVHATPLERIEAAEKFFANTGADIRHGGARSFYRIAADFVQMPELQAFRDTESYYAILAHEMMHWTRHPSRLDRSFDQKRFGDEGYAMEELVAEIGAAFLCADLGLTPETREDHAAYIGAWLKALKNDRKAIFIAASHAQKAADLLHACQASPNPPRPHEPARGLPVNGLY
jgi:antirestriction protein ArdC